VIEVAGKWKPPTPILQFFTTYKVPRDDCNKKWKSYSRQILDPTTLKNNLL